MHCLTIALSYRAIVRDVGQGVSQHFASIMCRVTPLGAAFVRSWYGCAARCALWSLLAATQQVQRCYTVVNGTSVKVRLSCSQSSPSDTSQ